MLARIFFFLIGFGFTVVGNVYIISYLNLLTIGYNFFDYVNFIIRRIEWLYSIIGIIIIIITNHNACIGDTNNIIIAAGIPPINGPKNGIILVTPIITEINNIYGILNIVNIKNVNTPIINESKILPPINLLNVILLCVASLKINLALFSEHIAYTIFLPNAINFSLSINI